MRHPKSSQTDHYVLEVRKYLQLSGLNLQDDTLYQTVPAIRLVPLLQTCTEESRKGLVDTCTQGTEESLHNLVGRLSALPVNEFY